ncbi:MAG: Heavy-metal-associated domain [Clostridiales bacterium]|jgi:copper chaperone CopZ|nr:Heavy-metal-associated domain [Clostridiales bacterium]
MGVKKIEIHQVNMYCQHCFNNVVRAVSKIKEIMYLDINMNEKTIIIKYQDDSLNNNDIRQFINKALTTGIVS